MKSKLCSGCRSRSYCSKRCQRDDWAAYHRRECNEMCRTGEADEADIGRDCRFRARANFAGYVERIYNTHIDAFKSCAQQMAPLGSLIVSIDAISFPIAAVLSTVPDFLAVIEASFGDNIAQRRRINGYLSQMLETPDIHIAYAMFSLGLLTIHLLVRMRKDANNVFRVASFLTIGIKYVRSIPANLSHILILSQLSQGMSSR